MHNLDPPVNQAFLSVVIVRRLRSRRRTRAQSVMLSELHELLNVLKQHHSLQARCHCFCCSCTKDSLKVVCVTIDPPCLPYTC